MTAALVSRRASSPDRPGSVRVWGPLLALVLITAGGVAVASWPTEGAVPAQVEAGTPPLAYTIVYETRHGEAPAVEEQFDVQRPFRSRLSTPTHQRVTDAGLLATRSDGGRWLRLEVPIALAAGDLRPEHVIDPALDQGLVRSRGTRTVAGRPCRLLRFGGPVSGGVFTPVGTDPDEYADVCIDGQGLVLSEIWTMDGTVVRSRHAIEVREREVDADRFAVPADVTTLSTDDGGGAAERVDATFDPGFAEHWRPGPLPDGFAFVGRWAVVPPALGGPVPSGEARGADIALITDAWTRGPDLLLIDQGAARRGAGAPWDDGPAIDVDLGALGPAELALNLRMTEVRILRPDGGFVRVAGTLPPDDLLEIARTLHQDQTGDES